MEYVKVGEMVRLALDEQESDNMQQFYHEDYMYLRETEMLTFEDFRQSLIDDFASGKVTSSNRKTLHEDYLSCSFSHRITFNEAYRRYSAGTSFEVRVMSLKKDGLVWRQVISFN